MTVEDYSAVLELRKIRSSSLDKSVNLATVRMAWMKRGQPGRGGRTKCFFYNFNFFSLARLHVQRLQPLLEENRGYFLAPKALIQVPKVQASSVVWVYGPP